MKNFVSMAEKRRFQTQVKIWHECQSEFLSLGTGKVVDVSEGGQGEDRYTFECGLCGKTHTNAMAVR